ncbi:unnamed protein product [Phaedon cochleariae]|uniref:Ig-like domain-containing protein n=1 Tax=Phaedon cochleariae TaxID=80249 RepID=A0A9N9X238_PHACE|nr:unnamed protein product [Phaedon cochleariae]
MNGNTICHVNINPLCLKTEAREISQVTAPSEMSQLFHVSVAACVCKISWMRKRDLHILTSSIHTYTGDARFSVRHPEHSDDWDLRIEYVQKRDAGVYECQVNTEPKINLAIMLEVDGSVDFEKWAIEDLLTEQVSLIPGGINTAEVSSCSSRLVLFG